MANAPEKFLAWRWEDVDDEKRLVYSADSKKPNAGNFVLAKEDHTIGNLLRLQLLRDPSVRFAGYRIPHPLISECHVRVETMDSKLTPIQVRFHNTSYPNKIVFNLSSDSVSRFSSLLWRICSWRRKSWTENSR